MSTDAKRAGNAKYLQQFKQVSLRFLPDDLEKVKAAAAAAGEGVAPYILRAVQDRMEGRQGLPDDLRRAVKAAAEEADEDAAQWLRRAVVDQAERDKRLREIYAAKPKARE